MDTKSHGRGINLEGIQVQIQCLKLYQYQGPTQVNYLQLAGDLWQKLPQLALSSLDNVCGKNYCNWLLVVWIMFVAKITAIDSQQSGECLWQKLLRLTTTIYKRFVAKITAIDSQQSGESLLASVGWRFVAKITAISYNNM